MIWAAIVGVNNSRYCAPPALPKPVLLVPGRVQTHLLAHFHSREPEGAIEYMCNPLILSPKPQQLLPTLGQAAELC